LTRTKYVQQIWMMFGVVALLVGIWTFTVPVDNLWSVPGRALAMMVGGGALAMAAGVALYLTIITYLPSYWSHLLVVGASVGAVAYFLFADVVWADALDFTLMLSYGLLPFVIAGGAIYGVKVRPWLMWTWPALIPPYILYQMWRTGPRELQNVWPTLLIADLVEIIWFLVSMREPDKADGVPAGSESQTRRM
jgi:hypothetical protein